VTLSLLHGKKEASIIPEISELKRRGHDLLIAPTYPREEVLHGDAKPLLSDVVSRPPLSVDLARVAVRQFMRNATAASETLGWLLFRGRSASVLLRNPASVPGALVASGHRARYWNADQMRVQC
jgi:colanic acid/amylovoran biosynthesis glycosyltransferase